MQSPRFRICTHPTRPHTYSSPWLLLLSAVQRLCHVLGPINHRLQGSTTRPRTPLHGETERQLNHQSADHLASHRVCHSSSERCGMVLESVAYLYGSSSTCRTVSSVEYSTLWSMYLCGLITAGGVRVQYFVDYPAMMMFSLHQGIRIIFSYVQPPPLDSLLSNVNIFYLLPNLIAQSARDPIPTPTTGLPVAIQLHCQQPPLFCYWCA